MNLPNNEVGRRVNSKWAAVSENKSAGRSPVTKPPFEHAFCGVLVSLILAIAVILSAVAVIVASHR